MRKPALVASTIFFSLCITAVCAQPAQNSPQNPAIHTDDTNNSASPVAGANSFTMSEAKSRLADKGYMHISALKKDRAGVWRGTATKDDRPVHVSVDYQGNVNTD